MDNTALIIVTEAPNTWGGLNERPVTGYTLHVNGQLIATFPYRTHALTAAAKERETIGKAYVCELRIAVVRKNSGRKSSLYRATMLGPSGRKVSWHVVSEYQPDATDAMAEFVEWMQIGDMSANDFFYDTNAAASLHRKATYLCWMTGQAMVKRARDVLGDEAVSDILWALAGE